MVVIEKHTEDVGTCSACGEKDDLAIIKYSRAENSPSHSFNLCRACRMELWVELDDY